MTKVRITFEAEQDESGWIRRNADAYPVNSFLPSDAVIEVLAEVQSYGEAVRREVIEAVAREFKIDHHQHDCVCSWCRNLRAASGYLTTLGEK